VFFRRTVLPGRKSRRKKKSRFLTAPTLERKPKRKRNFVDPLLSVAMVENLPGDAPRSAYQFTNLLRRHAGAQFGQIPNRFILCLCLLLLEPGDLRAERSDQNRENQ